MQNDYRQKAWLWEDTMEPQSDELWPSQEAKWPQRDKRYKPQGERKRFDTFTEKK